MFHFFASLKSKTATLKVGQPISAKKNPEKIWKQKKNNYFCNSNSGTDMMARSSRG